MRIPRCLHSVLGMLAGAIVLLAGITILSVVFVAAFKAVRYAMPFITETACNLYGLLSRWLPL